eukprot:CAMPEP_0194317752 /NCGR_PEP_ID=MMETSP0171-20130528/14488_1 /TAXON_ID=218684 /ORGANISM="Corethron pennatum, Strain L29A3" /LENGTH=120 /DNA_ID=CAMNT_0039074461 /DNA_START=383 /DNA_END=745 /DNA_ORIENTATION=-
MGKKGLKRRAPPPLVLFGGAGVGPGIRRRTLQAVQCPLAPGQVKPRQCVQNVVPAVVSGQDEAVFVDEPLVGESGTAFGGLQRERYGNGEERGRPNPIESVGVEEVYFLFPILPFLIAFL